MPSQEAVQLLATPCLPCRENHLKCDRKTPVCGRCADSGRRCKLAFKFKKSTEDSFRKNQRWINPPRHLTYIDETSRLTSGISIDDTSIDGHGFEEFSEPVDARGPEAAASQDFSQLDGNIFVPHVEDQSGRASPSNRIIFPRPEPPTVDGSLAENHTTTNAPHFASYPTIPQLGKDPYQGGQDSNRNEASALPLADKTEAVLFRHYIRELATCLDLCDPQRHFELVVPQRARHCPVLLKACLALAARHLSETTDYDPLASNRYHDECLSVLNPMLTKLSASILSDENLFSATIILRMLEEFDVSTTGQDHYGHLLGIHAFANVGHQYMAPGSLSAASFWVGLRQDIYAAILTQSPLKMNLEQPLVDRTFGPADDYTWSNRAVVILADVLNLCFADAAPTSAQWATLNERCTAWESSKPSSFEPFFFKEREGLEAFPEVWHSSRARVTGLQHHILAQLFLAQYDPSIPRVGTRRGPAVRRMTQQIQHLMRHLCGLAMSNQWTPPAMFAASTGIAMFGDRFKERSDQEAMMELLRRTERNHARPTKAIQEQLKRVWEWIPTPEDE